jgi:hypothetical protein
MPLVDLVDAQTGAQAAGLLVSQVVVDHNFQVDLADRHGSEVEQPVVLVHKVRVVLVDLIHVIISVLAAAAAADGTAVAVAVATVSLEVLSAAAAAVEVQV